LLIATLAFGGAVLGAVTVIAVAVVVSREDAPPEAEPLTPIPVSVPMAVVPTPNGAPASGDPMLPSTPDAQGEANAEADAGPAAAEILAEDEPAPRRRRRRRRQRRQRPTEVPEPPSDEPIYTISPDRIPPIGMPPVTTQ